MKQFDVYIRKRLIEWDVLVYSIPYRDGITAENKMVLESCLNGYKLLKYVATQNDSELAAHLDQMIALCYEKLAVGVDISATAALADGKTLSWVESAAEISIEDVSAVLGYSESVETRMEIIVAPLLAIVGRSFGGKEFEAEVGQSLKDVAELCMNSFRGSTELDAVLTDNAKIGLTKVDNETESDVELSSLSYGLYCLGESAFQLGAAVLGTDSAVSLGAGNVNLDVDVGLDDLKMSKYTAASSAIALLDEVAECVTKHTYAKTSELEILSEIKVILKQYRLLEQVDEYAVEDIDDMALEDLDYILL